MDKLDYWTMREGDEMKTAEEIVAEIERRAKYYERLDTAGSEYAAHITFAMRLLNAWIEEKND